MNKILARLAPIASLATGRDRQLLLIGLMLLAAVATTITTATGALFTDSDSVGSNTFTTGTVILSTAPTSALVSFTDMAPGDVTNGTMTVSNGGSLELRYAVTSATTENTLAAQLDMTIWDEAAETTVNGVCDTTAPPTVLYGPADVGSTTGIDVIGDPAQGSQTGDRTLAASASETLCFRVELPSSTGNTYQGLTTTATLTFASEQTKNN